MITNGPFQWTCLGVVESPLTIFPHARKWHDCRQASKSHRVSLRHQRYTTGKAVVPWPPSSTRLVYELFQDEIGCYKSKHYTYLGCNRDPGFRSSRQIRLVCCFSRWQLRTTQLTLFGVHEHLRKRLRICIAKHPNRFCLRRCKFRSRRQIRNCRYAHLWSVLLACQKLQLTQTRR